MAESLWEIKNGKIIDLSKQDVVRRIVNSRIHVDRLFTLVFCFDFQDIIKYKNTLGKSRRLLVDSSMY